MKSSLSGYLWKRKQRRKERDATNRKPRVLAGSIAGFCRVVAVATLTALGVGESRAAILFWDPNLSGGTGLGGVGGNWDLITANWYNGAADQIWSNVGNNEAVFLGGGDANVTTTLNVGALTFRENAYNLFGTGALVISGGTRTITVQNAGNSFAVTITTQLQGTGGFTKAGAGTLSLTGDSSGGSGITGGVTLAEGTLVLDYAGGAPNILKSSNFLTITGSSTLQMNAEPTSNTAAVLSTLSFNGGEGTIESIYGNGAGNASLTFSSLAARAPGATGNFVLTGGTNPTNNKISITGQAAGFINQGVFFGGNNYAFYDTTLGGFVRGINYGTDANTAIQVASATGIAAANANKHVQVTGDTIRQGNLTILTLNLNGNGFSTGLNQTPGTTLTLTNAGILKSGGGLAAISGGTLAVGANELIVRADLTTEKLTINSVITGSGGLTKSGLGSVLLTPSTAGALSLGGATTTSGSPALTFTSAVPASLVNGIGVFGPGIQANTTIVGVAGSTVTLSQPATATSAIALTYNGTVGGGPNTIDLTPAEAGTLSIGQVVNGVNVAPNTTITAINLTNGLLTVSNNTTGSASLQDVTFGGATVAFGTTQNYSTAAGSLSLNHGVTAINNTTLTLNSAAPGSLVPGMSVSGTGIAAGTTIQSVAGTTVTLSQVATSDSSTKSSFQVQVGGGPNVITVGGGQIALLQVGMAVSGTNVQAGTTITALNIFGNTVTLSQATTGALSNQNLTFGGSTIAFGATTLTLTPAEAATLTVGSTVTGTNIALNTTVTDIQTVGANAIVTLSTPTANTASTQFLTFGGATVVSINSPLGGLTRVNGGILAVNSSSLPPGGAVTLSGGAELAAVNSTITNNITVTGSGATLSASGGNKGNFSGTINVGGYDFNLKATDFADNTLTPDLNISGPIVKGGAGTSGQLTVPFTSKGIVTLSGNNSDFTGRVFIDTGAKLSIARLNSLPNGNPVDLSGTLILALDGNGGAAYTGGNGVGTPQILTLPNVNLTLLGDGIIQPDRDGTAYGGYFLNARNKTVQLNKLALPGVTLTVQNNSGYGVEFLGTTTLQSDVNDSTFNVANATASNVVQGLTLSGIVSGQLTLDSALTKTGPGTLVLGNSGNTFGGGSSFIDVQGGVISVASDGALGAIRKTVNLAGGTTTVTDPTITVTSTAGLVPGMSVTGTNIPAGATILSVSANGTEFIISAGATGTSGGPLAFAAVGQATGVSLNGAGSTLRATGTFSTSLSRAITLNQATSNTIEVTGGNTFTVASPFLFPAATPGSDSNGIIKGENGILLITANNNPAVTPWIGPTLINAGAVRVLNGDALGSSLNPGFVTVARTGAALQIGSGANVKNRLTLSGSGLSSAGALQSLGGAVNTASGQIILSTGGTAAAAATLGADAGSTLNITGGITGTNGSTLTLNSSGIINITANPLDPTYTVTGDPGSNTTITNVSNTANIVIGQAFRGPNIPSNAVVTAKTANTITLNVAATATVSGSTFTAKSNLSLIKNGSGTTTLGVNSPGFAGSITVNRGLMTISGAGVTIGQAVASNVIAIQGPSASLVVDDSIGAPVERIANGNSYSVTVGGGATNITLTAAQAATLTVGQTVTGVGIFPNTTVSKIFTNSSGAATGLVTLSGATSGTSGAQTLTFAGRNVILSGGNLTYNGNASNSIQNFGWLTVSRGATNVIASNPTGAGTVSILFGGLASNTNAPTNATPPGNALGADATLDFQGLNLGVSGSNKISFIAAPPMTNAVIQRTTMNGSTFVSYNAIGGLSLATTTGNAVVNVGNTSFLSVGQAISGTGIPASTTISAIAPGVSITLSNAPTVTTTPATANFLTFGNTNGVQAFTAYNTSNDISLAAATATLDITADPTFAAPATINGFRISGSTVAVGTALQGNTLTLSVGGILSTSGNNAVNFPVVAFAGTEAFLAVNSGQLAMGSLLTGTAGLVKGLPGTLLLNSPGNRVGIANLSGQTLTGNVAVDAGTLKLGGGNNTLTPNQFLIVAPGATLDLNGTSQFAFGTRGDGAAQQGNAGTFTNSGAGAAALILGADNGGVNFGGVIKQEAAAGAMNFFKGSGQTYNFYNANTYSGATVFAGGTNELRDGGTLANTSSIDLNYARLTFNDDVTFALANRVNLAAPITMRGGSLVYGNGRAQTETTQAVGNVTLVEGQNMIQAINGGTGVNSAVLTLASLARSGGSTATLRFPDANAPGTIGNSGRILITSPLTLSNNLIGPWAVVDREFASNIPTLGVGRLNQVGFAGYSTNFLNRQPLATDNIRATLNVPGLAVDTTVNTLAVNVNVPATTIDLGGRQLTLASGGLILAVNADNQTISLQNGTITSGAAGVGGDLYLHALNYAGANRTFTVSAGITNNGGGAVRLIKASGAVDAASDFLVLSGTSLNFGGSIVVGGATTAGSNTVIVTNATGITLGMAVTGNGLPAGEVVTGILGNTVTITTGTGVTTTAGNNTYTGGTVINGGNLLVGPGGNIPAGGITINGGDVSGVGTILQDVNGVINSANTVTVNGLGALALTGSNTLAGLVFNNTGGGATTTPTPPTVTTFRSATALGTGILTLGGGGIISNPLNPATVATVAGRLDFGAALSPVSVSTYVFAGFTDFAPTTAGLILQGVIGSPGGINKTGLGVLQFNAQDVFTGPVNVTAGGIQIGAGNAGSRFSALSLGAGTRLNLLGNSTVIGSLIGSGIVTSSAGSPTLTVGFDGTSSSFSGQISRFNDATPAAVTLVKVGAGTMTIASAQLAISGSSGGVTVNGGGLTYSGIGKAYPSTTITPVTYNVNTGGTLTLDNTATNLADRMGLSAAGTLNLSGGTLVLTANSAGSSETINTLNLGNGGNAIFITGGAGGPTTMTVGGTFSNQGGQDSALIRGLNLGLNLGGAGSVNLVVSGTYAATGGAGGAGSDTMSIRPDIIGDATASGLGTGFVTRDSGNVLRPLNQGSELSPDMIQAAFNATANAGLTAANNAAGNLIVVNQTLNSLTLLGAGVPPAIASGLGLPGGVFGSNGAPLTLTVTSGGILALTNSTIGVGAIASGTATQVYHVVGAATTLNVNASITSSSAGIVKADDGTLIFNAPQYYTGTAGTNGTTINGGTLKLNGGNNTILVQPTGNVPTVMSLFLNGGTLDLNGTSQVFERITNNNILAGMGGNVINSGGGPVTLSSTTAANSTFAGSIGTGATNNSINLLKSGAGILTLTNASTYTGSTLIRGGGLTIQDSGALTNTSAVTVNFGTLLLNEAGLNPLTPVTRIPATAPITLNGGILQQNSGGSIDSVATFNTLNLASGASTITQSTVQNSGSTSLINIGSLVQSAASTVNFSVPVINNVAQGTLGGGGLNNNEVRITSITPSGGSAIAPASLLVNGILPGWITVSGTDFAGYLPALTAGSQGIGAIGTANFPGYTGSLPIANSSNNISLATNPLTATSLRVNSLAIRNPAAGVDVFLALNLPTDTLTIGTGGLLINSGTNSGASATIGGGNITAGSLANAPGVLYVTSTGSNRQLINSQIVNNGNQTYSANTDGISNVITVNNTSGLAVGQPVSGPGILGGSTITAITSPTTFTIGSNTTAASFDVRDITKAGSSTTNGSTAVLLPNSTSLLVGEYVTGPGIPAGTVITALPTAATPNVITISNPATFTVAPVNYFVTVGGGSSTITVSAAQAATLKPGMVVTGTNIQTNLNTGVFTTIQSVAGNIVTLSQPATNAAPSTQNINFASTLAFGQLATYRVTSANTFNGSSTVVLNTANLVEGMTVSGPGIPAGTVIRTVSAASSQITLGTIPNNPFIPTPPFVNANGTAVGINLVFGTPLSVGDGTSGAVSLVKTGTGTLSLTPQLVMDGSLNGTNGNPENTVTVSTTAGLLPGMTVSIPLSPTSTLNSTIVSIDSPTTFTMAASVVVNGSFQITYGGPGAGLSNTYTGGTFVNQGTLSLEGLPGTTVIPGDLTITGNPNANSTVTMVTNAQQIAAASNVTINGSGVLNLTGANTLASLLFNNSGGNSAPTLAIGAAGALTLTNGITAINDSLAFTPTISGPNSTLTLPNSTITTSGASPDSLIISVPILPAGALVKAGAGSLILNPTVVVNGTTAAASPSVTVTNVTGLAIGMTVSGNGIPAGESIIAIAGNTITLTTGTGVTGGTNSLTFGGNTFSTGVNLTAGSIILAASSNPSTVGAAVTAGPLGTGTLNMADGTAILSDGTLRTIANAVVIAVNATFGTLPGNGAALAGNGVILSGSVTLTGGGAHTLTVPNLTNVTTISGTLSGGTNLNLTKSGTGTLILSNAANTYAGTTAINVNGGVLKLGAATAVPAGLDLTVAIGAEYDINAQASQFLKTLSGGGLVSNSGAAQTLVIGGISAADVTTNVNATFDGILTAATTGNLALTKAGLGRQILTGASRYTGATTISSGSLIVNGSLANTAVTVAGGATLGGTGFIGNTLGGSVTVTGGAAAASRGVIDLTTNTAIGTLSLSTSGTGNALTLGGTAGNAAVLNFDIANTTTDRIDILGSARLLVSAGGAIINLTQLAGTPLAAGIYPLITFSSATNTGSFTVGTGFLGGWTLNQSSSALQLVTGGAALNFYWKGDVSGVWNAPPANTNWSSDAGGTTDSAALPSVTSIVNFKATGSANLNTTLGQNFTIDQLVFNSTAPNTTVTIGGSNTLTLNNNLQMLSGTGAVTISTTGLTLGGSQSWINGATTDLTVSAPITGSAALIVSTSTTGKVILSGNNSAFTGGITVVGNVANTALQLGSATALGPISGPTLSPLVVNIGALDMNGQSGTVGSLSSTVATGFIKNTSATPSTLTVTQSNTTTYSGKLGDTAANGLALVLNGGGTLQLVTTANTYTGGTTINDGTLRMGNGANEIATSLGIGTVTINAAGVLNFAPGNVATAFNIANNFSLNGGTIQSTDGNQHLQGTISVTAIGGNFTPSATASRDLFLDGQLTGTGPITVGGSGAGKVILTNNTNTYNGTLTNTGAGNTQVDTPLSLAQAALVNNAPGFKFGTAVTSATLGSLAGSSQGGFALTNTNAAPAAVTLTVGGNNTDTTYAGVMTNAAGILGSLTKVGTGTLILSGLNTYRGATTVNAGTLRVNNASTTVSVTGLGAVTVNNSGTTLGGNGLIQGGANVSPGSVTLNSNTFLDPGIAPGTVGTLRIGPAGASPQPTTLTFANLSTYRFDVGIGAGDRVLVTGPAVIAAGANLIINQISVPDQGLYTLLDSTTTVTGTFTFVPAQVPTGYKLVHNSSSVDLQHLSTIGAITPAPSLQVIKGASVAFNFTVANSAPTGSANLSFTATSGLNTTGSVSSPVVVGPGGATGTGTGLSFNSAALPAGLGQTGNFTVTDSSATNSPQAGTVTVDVLDHAAFGSFTGGTLNLPNVRLGYTGPVASTNSLSVTNTAGVRANLKGNTAPVGNLSISGVSAVTPSNSGLISASLATGQASGTYSQNFNYTFADDSTISGSNANLGSVTITAAGGVYNGQGLWGAVASGNWGTTSSVTGNWTLTNANPGGVPGLDGAASINDTATIGSGLTGTLSLNGASPFLNALNFTNTSGTLAQGSSGSVTLQSNGAAVTPTIGVTGGTPTISAPLTLTSNVTATVTNAADQLTISGIVSSPGSAGIAKAGPGTLVLSGANTYAGKTAVNGGTLSVTNETNLGAVPGGLPVADQISVSGGATLAFTGDASLDAKQGVTIGAVGGNLNVAASKTVVVAGALSGTGTFTKSGPGTLDLRNAITGPSFTLSAGTLTPAFHTAVDDTLGNVVNFNGGTIAIDVLGSAGPGFAAGHDRLSAAGQIKINSPTTLAINLGGYVPLLGTTFVLFESNEPDLTAIVTNSFFVVNGTLATPGTTFQTGGSAFQLSYGVGPGLNDIVLEAVIPEPGSVVMLLGGCGLLAGLRRSRRRPSAT